MNYSIAQQSLIGTRKSNQDRIGYAEKDNCVILALADGLGGYSAGDMAAEVFVDTVINSFEAVKQPVIADPAAFMIITVMHAHSLINRRAKQNGITASSPRTTGLICIVQNGYAYWAHVGDSRVYHFRDNRVLMRTIDHSTSEQMHQDGLIKEEDMNRNDMQGQLVQCIGGPQRPVVTLSAETPLKPNDLIVLCSDGVWRSFPGNDIARQLHHNDLEEALDLMLERAEKVNRKSCDNISVVCLRWEQRATTARPLYKGGYPEIDQHKLWRQTLRKARVRKIDRKKRPLPPAKNRTEDLEQAIEEIESFINDIEKLI